MEIQQLDWSKLKPSTPEFKAYLGRNDSRLRKSYKEKTEKQQAIKAEKKWLKRKNAKLIKSKASGVKQKRQHNIKKAYAMEKAYQEKLGRKLRDIV